MTLSTPASRSRSICSSVRMPSETATVSGSSSLIAHRFADALEQPRRRAAHGNDDAELAGAARVRRARGCDEVFDGLESGSGSHVGRVARALRAEIAIFRTAALFGVVEHLDGDAVSAVPRAHLVGQRQQAWYMRGVHRSERSELAPADRALPFEDGAVGRAHGAYGAAACLVREGSITSPGIR